MQAPQESQFPDDGRRSRFNLDSHVAVTGFRESSLPAAFRDRDFNQPGRRPAEGLPSRGDPTQRRGQSPFGAPGTPPPSTAVSNGTTWTPSRHASFHTNQPVPPSAATTSSQYPTRAAPIRSLSFSTPSDLQSRFHPFMPDTFASPFEDEEDDYDVLIEMNGYGAQELPPPSARSASYTSQPARDYGSSMAGSFEQSRFIRGTRAAALAAADNASRSRSQSLAATNRRQQVAGMASSLSNLPQSGYGSQGVWNESSAGISVSAHNALSGYALGQTNNRTRHHLDPIDPSNMSPFARDLDQILLDSGATLHDNWVNGPRLSQLSGRDDGGGSGATSRRHSVSIVQPRTRRGSAVTGFSGTALGPAPENETEARPYRESNLRLGLSHSGLPSSALDGGRFGGRSMISDDELAGDFHALSINQDMSTQNANASRHALESRGTHVSSLPVYGLIQGISPTSQGSSSGFRQVRNGGGGRVPSPSYQQTFSQTNPSRRASASPNRFGARAVSRDRETLPGVIENEVQDYDIQSLLQRPGLSPSGLVGSFTSMQRQEAMNAQAQQLSDSQERTLQQTAALLAMYGDHLSYQGDGQHPSPLSPHPTDPMRGAATAYLRSGGGTGGLQSGDTDSQGRPAFPYGASSSQNITSGSSRFSAHPTSPNGQPFPHNLSNLETRQLGRAASAQFGSPVDRQNQHAQFHVSNHPPVSPVTSGPASNTGQPLADLGKGVPLHRIAPSTPLFIVEFKAGRSDLFFCSEPGLARQLSLGDFVIVEADRGKDLGKIVKLGITGEEVEAFQRHQQHQHSVMMGEDDPGQASARSNAKEIMPKRLYSKATYHDLELCRTKAEDELKALELCQSKVLAKKLPMEVVEAEYQWDRRKLTFYFVSDRRIDFRELVRELFRLYKTRIWMACLPSALPVDG